MAFPSSISTKAIKNKKDEVNMAQPVLVEPMLDSDDHLLPSLSPDNRAQGTKRFRADKTDTT